MNSLSQQQDHGSHGHHHHHADLHSHDDNHPATSSNPTEISQEALLTQRKTLSLRILKTQLEPPKTLYAAPLEGSPGSSSDLSSAFLQTPLADSTISLHATYVDTSKDLPDGSNKASISQPLQSLYGAPLQDDLNKANPPPSLDETAHEDLPDGSHEASFSVPLQSLYRAPTPDGANESLTDDLPDGSHEGSLSVPLQSLYGAPSPDGSNEPPTADLSDGTHEAPTPSLSDSSIEVSTLVLGLIPDDR